MQNFFNVKPDDAAVILPEPDRNGSVSLEEALEGRRSFRKFLKTPVDLQTASQLLWAGQGKSGEGSNRTAPSAGATFPVELYIVVARVIGVKPGIYHYLQEEHALVSVKQGKFAKPLKLAALAQEAIELAPLSIIVAAQFSRTESRYGSRARRYVYMECGHVGQNIQLQAFSMGMGSVVIGSFRDDEVKKVLSIDEEILYIIPVGRIG